MMQISFMFPSRRDELRRLRIDQFEMRDNKGVLLFEIDPMKHGNKREVYLTEELTNALVNLKRKRKKMRFFFSNERDSLMTPTNVFDVFDRARQDANIDDVCLHQIRIRSVTDCFRAGLSQPVVKTLSGLKTDAIVSRYYKISDVDMQHATRRLEAYKNRQ